MEFASTLHLDVGIYLTSQNTKKSLCNLESERISFPPTSRNKISLVPDIKTP